MLCNLKLRISAKKVNEKVHRLRKINYLCNQKMRKSAKKVNEV